MMPTRVTAVAVEPTTSRAGARSQRLKPLGQALSRQAGVELLLCLRSRPNLSVAATQQGM